MWDHGRDFHDISACPFVGMVKILAGVALCAEMPPAISLELKEDYSRLEHVR
jgi:hypothetical protein